MSRRFWAFRRPPFMRLLVMDRSRIGWLALDLGGSRWQILRSSLPVLDSKLTLLPHFVGDHRWEVGGLVMALDEVFNADGSLRGFRAVVNIPAAPGKKSWRRRKKTFRIVDFGSRSAAKTEAEAWCVEQKRALRRGSWSDPTRSRLSIEMYADDVWDLAMQGLRANVIRNYDLAWKNNIVPVVGRVPIGELNRSHIERIKAAMKAAGAAPSTTNTVISALSRVLRFAVDERVISSNPASAKGIRAREIRSAVKKAPTVDPSEMEMIASECDRRFLGHGEPVRLAFWTGARAEEIWAMRVGDIDLARRRIVIERAWSGSNARGRVLDDTKSGRSRVVPILDDALDLMVRLTADRQPEDWIFSGSRGQALWHRNFRASVDWPRAVIAAGFPGFRFHDLRHSYTTYLLDQGVPVHTVQAILGHSSIATTQGYIHTNDHGLEVAIKTIRERKSNDQ